LDQEAVALLKNLAQDENELVHKNASVRMPMLGEKQITLLHLRTHTSGLAANANNGYIGD
jgi:CubicO group peptidase (beta-lactamase class C family)